MTHAPDEQTWSVGHTVPQRPQLFASVLVSVHVPPQFVSPAVAQPQTPSEQMSPVRHKLPQAPQLSASSCRLVHTALRRPTQQSLSPAPQTASPWLATCAGTAGAPTVISCTLLGLPGGRWQIVTLGTATAWATPAARTRATGTTYQARPPTRSKQGPKIRDIADSLPFDEADRRLRVACRDWRTAWLSLSKAKAVLILLLCVRARRLPRACLRGKTVLWVKDATTSGTG